MLFSNLPAFGILTLHADDDNGASTAIGGTAAGGGGGDLVPDEDVMQPRGPERLIAYAHRAAVTLRHGIRYVAYSSDIGESFRPIANPAWVNASYAVAIAYIAGDVAYHGYLANEAGKSTSGVARVVVETSVFQLLASLLLPSVIIHSAVHQSHKIFRTGPLKKWGPVVTGLSLIPFMPYMDEPVEHATVAVFNAVWPDGDDAEEPSDKFVEITSQTKSDTDA